MKKKKTLEFTTININFNLEGLSKALYFESFPIEERRDWQKIKSNQQKEEFNFYGVSQDNEFIAIISVWDLLQFCYIEHFAVRKDLRNKGLGSNILQQIIKQYNKDFVLEVDIPNNDIAIRRTEFYLRNGFVLLQDKYIQPPYSKELPSVEMKIMTTNKEIPFSLIRDKLYTTYTNS